VSAPFDRPTGTLAVRVGSRLTATGAGVLGGATLELQEALYASRTWTVDAANLSVGDGGAVPYRASRLLSLRGGDIANTFAVKASPLVPYSIDGGAGIDTLTYDAEGRTTSGDADPPDGAIASRGVRPVEFAAIEYLSIR
jgi:hypothetical protein